MSVEFRSFPSFKEASVFAKVTAARAGRSSSVKRQGLKWTVCYSTSKRELPVREDVPERYNLDTWQERDLVLKKAVEAADWYALLREDASDRQRERSLLIEEMQEDADWYARSEEDGWFYPDDFEGNPPIDEDHIIW